MDNVSTNVVYFDQHLGAAHFKCWLNKTFNVVFCKKLKKEEKTRKLMPSLYHNASQRKTLDERSVAIEKG